MKLRLFSIVCAVSLFALASCRDHLTGPQNNTNTVSDTIADWTFDGNLNDVSGNGHTGFSSLASYGLNRFGNPSSAFLFNQNARMTVNNTENLSFTANDSFTISTWVKLSGSDTTIICSRDMVAPYARTNYGIGALNTDRNGNGHMGFYFAEVIAGIPNGSSSLAGGFGLDNFTHPVDLSAWHMVTLVVAAHSVATFYVDSIAVSSIRDNIDTMPWTDPTVPFLIGAESDSSASVDDFIIVHHAMSSQEVLSRFHEGGWYAGRDTVSQTLATGWTKGSFRVSSNIQDICFPTPQIGYACGFGGTVLKSVDSGMTWTRQIIATSQDLYGISFINPLIGIVGGNNGAAYYTRDGGATWIASSTTGFQTQIGAVENIRDLKFIGNNAIMVGGTDVPQPGQHQGFGLTSADSGKTWVDGLGADNNWLYSISQMSGQNFTQDSNLATIVGAQGQVRWSHYANNWDGEPIDGSYITGPDFFGVDFAGQYGFAVGAFGTIYFQIYSDNPSSWIWTSQTSGISTTLRTVHVVSSSEAWVAGDNGVILHTLNDGQTWTRADIQDASIQWNKIAARDAHHIAFVGGNGTLYWRTE